MSLISSASGKEDVLKGEEYRASVSIAQISANPQQMCKAKCRPRLYKCLKDCGSEPSACSSNCGIGYSQCVDRCSSAPQCTIDSHCFGIDKCINNKCVEGCRTDFECPGDDNICFKGTCWKL